MIVTTILLKIHEHTCLKRGLLPNPIQEFFAWLGKKSCQLLVDN